MKKFNPLTVKSIQRETKDAVSIIFDVPDALRDDYQYVQGQHITLKHVIDGEEIRRCYSICAGVAEQQLRIAVKHIPEGRFSGFCNSRLKEGDALEVFPPGGRFYTELDTAAQRHYVGFAGGSGITPMMSLIKTTLQAEPDSSFTLFYGNRDAAGIIFLEELADLKNRYMHRLSIYHVLEDEPQEIELFNGRLDQEKCEAILKALINPDDIHAFFICGPSPMMDAVEAALLAQGVPRQKVNFERFVNMSGVAPPKAQRPQDRKAPDRLARVQIVIDGIRSGFDFYKQDSNVLDAAIAAGKNVPFACKGGVCCTCRAKVLEGEVKMAKNYGLEADEMAAGYVLTCQSTPTTETLVVSYDE